MRDLLILAVANFASATASATLTTGYSFKMEGCDILPAA